MKYIISKLVFDPLENHTAYWYERVGYVDTEEEAKDFCANGRVFQKKDCWQFPGPMNEFVYGAISHVSETQTVK